MFVNQHMIKIIFKDSKSSPSKEEKKGPASVKGNGKVQIVTSKLGGSASKVKSKKSPNTSKDSGSAGEDVISLKYTIDYPRVELHPFDTRKFQLYYADTKVNASYNINRCLELRAANR
mmetsp:Transcript_43279/g.57259  ORF Transcript_43279/g.57259 Transcript_43279/m.57259 type:complete len:118 (+) Transcript_43279:338-691(+)